jgi:ATP-binding cassette subfamily F protein uup
MAMRDARAERRTRQGTVRLDIEHADPSGRLVFEAERIAKRYDGRPIVQDFSARIMRGDRIGLIGPNGAGKTTLLRLLLGEVAPDAGTIRRGTNLQIAYYDQQREQLDPDRTVFDTIGDGNETVTIDGAPRHVLGYLRDFLFPPERARSPVGALSGGERNRLLLARLFTRPANVLVLDEPTNDLDLETLELVEARLVAWPGTLLLVTHDRVFLDNVVTSTLVFEGGGRVEEYVGGYQDWLRQRATPAAESTGVPRSSGPRAASAAATAVAAPRRLTFNEKRELESLPARIDALEAEQRRLTDNAMAPDFYKAGAVEITRTLARIDEIAAELTALYARWDELDSRSR